MALKTSLAGRVRNTTLPKTHALLPLHEAVVNGIQAIDARFPNDASARGRVTVRIHRDTQATFDLTNGSPGRAPLRIITGFSIEDNGIGFTPDNMASFETLDSDYKAPIGCRGVGRLLWLVAFDRIEVRSAYYDGDALSGRQFSFSILQDVVQGVSPTGLTDAGTTVLLDGFKKSFQQSAPKSTEAIAREIFEHCIWYFLREGGAPEVVVEDDDEMFSLKDFVEELGYTETAASFEVKGQKFEMLNLRLKTSARNATPRLHWCAANRVVKDESIAGKLPGLYARMKDGAGGEFTYVCYLSSSFLDDHVRSDRTDFDLPERLAGDALLDEPTLDDIRTGVLDKIAEALAEPLASAQVASKERINRYISTKAPKFRPLFKRIESSGIVVDPAMKDSDLEIELHKHAQRIENQLLTEGQAIFSASSGKKPEDYDERLAKYLETLTELNQSDLANYVARRRTTLDILEELIRSDDDGKYAREDSIHELIFPMRKDSNSVGADASNLWILDERLVFHDYLASDKTFKSMPITEADSPARPDILVSRPIHPDLPVLASDRPNPPLNSIVVVELKRPLRDDATEGANPIDQCLDYVERIREGRVKTSAGRPIPSSPQEPPAFCYIIADLTPTMESRCRRYDLTKTHDGLGYFGYNDQYKTYIEVISFDGLVNSAKQRNQAFFDRLGLPSS
ncbi:ATP-binding protein [Leucobacter tenebrionis]|uniref:ATP-binding protein n=1 Tax=Leucobacter tenebrionis TaxID=2873270 RepID=UPI001CA65232|nr:ATP-binding protein [Leucobacter tenebrionis]QZY51337.1 ATP-binding protein [Leucobacter tenebrionis]